MRTEEETYQLMKSCGDHFISGELFNEGISPSPCLFASHEVRRDFQRTH